MFNFCTLSARYLDRPVFNSAGSTLRFTKKRNSSAVQPHLFPSLRAIKRASRSPPSASKAEPGLGQLAAISPGPTLCHEEGAPAAGSPQPYGLQRPRRPRTAAQPRAGSAFTSSSSGLSEIKRSSGVYSQPSFTCDPSELRLRQRALFPGPAEGMFYS